MSTGSVVATRANVNIKGVGTDVSDVAVAVTNKHGDNTDSDMDEHVPDLYGDQSPRFHILPQDQHQHSNPGGKDVQKNLFGQDHDHATPQPVRADEQVTSLSYEQHVAVEGKEEQQFPEKHVYPVEPNVDQSETDAQHGLLLQDQVGSPMGADILHKSRLHSYLIYEF